MSKAAETFKKLNEMSARQVQIRFEINHARAAEDFTAVRKLRTEMSRLNRLKANARFQLARLRSVA